MDRIKIKEWDSEFFNLKVAEIAFDCIQDGEFITFINHLKEEKINLVYIYPQNTGSTDFLIHKSIPLVDTKVTFSKQPKEIEYFDSGRIKSYRLDQYYADLLKLAYESGTYSRFKLDSKFPEGSYEKLYKIWLDNSIDRKIADDLLIYLDNQDKVSGFVTYKISDDNLRIGLIAVSPESRGEGIGKSLLLHIEKIATDNNTQEILVDTQEENTGACRFYYNFGFKVKIQQPIFHLWL